jgi:hypothetical protein
MRNEREEPEDCQQAVEQDQELQPNNLNGLIQSLNVVCRQSCLFYLADIIDRTIEAFEPWREGGKNVFLITF